MPLSTPAPSRQRLSTTAGIAAAPYLPETLVSKAWQASISRLADHFPARGVSVFGYECRLGEPAAEADFLFCLQRGNRGREILAGTDALDALPRSDLLDHQVWASLRRFGKAWADDSPTFGHQLDNVWLEFDMRDADSDAPVPSVFFGPVSERLPSVEALKGLMVCALDYLGTGTAGTPVERTMFACCERLPLGATIFQVGAMLSRPSSPLRLCVRDISPQGILDYLAALDWPGEGSALGALMDDIGDHVDQVRLNIDAAATLGAKVGIECYIEPENAALKWPDFIDHLVARSWCTAAKRDGLHRYGGFVSDAANQAWPEHLRLGAALAGHRMRSVFFRDFNHFKLVLAADGSVEAKAYLRVHHLWLSPDDLDALLEQTRAARTGS